MPSINDALFEQGRSLKELTTLRVGGPARYFVEITTIPQLQQALRECHKRGLRFCVLGKGSNILFDDRGFDGVIIANNIQSFQESDGTFCVGAGYSFARLGAQTAKQGWAGLEFAAGIPGSVGGAVFMNAGAGGQEVRNVVTHVTFINSQGERQELHHEQLQWGYRHSSFQDMPGAIGAVTFKLIQSPTAQQLQRRLIDYRRKTQPYTQLSAGCAFRNPQGGSAGKLIQECGLKGTRMGDAEVSDIHANFIINRGAATAADVQALAAHIQATVYEQTGHWLEMEVRCVPYEA